MTNNLLGTATMCNIKDPKRSLPFYQNVLGMRLLRQFDFPTEQFTVYYLGYNDANSKIPEESERALFAASNMASVELTHNWGKGEPKVEDFTDTKDPRAYGNIGITVPSVEQAIERFKMMGVPFDRSGDVKGAVVRDPDGYCIQLTDPKSLHE